MQKLLCTVALCLAVGCGPNFTGTYAGTLASVMSCSDGSGGTSNDSTTWTVAESGSDLSITNSGSCSPFSATPAGNIANVGQKSCGSTTKNGWTMVPTLTGGTLTLNSSNQMGVNLTLTATVSSTSGASGTCSGTVSGNLARQP